MSRKTCVGCTECTEHARTHLYCTWYTFYAAIVPSIVWHHQELLVTPHMIVFVWTKTNPSKTMGHFLANTRTLPEWSERFCKSNMSIPKSWCSI